MTARLLWSLLTLAQAALGTRVLLRLLDTAGGNRVAPCPHYSATAPGSVAVVVPVLNEVARLGPCLDGLTAQGPEVGEIVVVDGGSTDGTQALVATYAARDARVRLVDAGPIPPGWNGKAWGLEVGAREANPTAPWLLTIDADVRPAPRLAAALLAHTAIEGVAALSVATRQELSGPAEGLIHPALLATLVYRFGIPGHATDQVDRVQANGQCFLLRRDVLARAGGFAVVRDSRCEDVRLARALAASGTAVGFYEAGDLARVQMYASAGEAWRNWPRSLPLRDRFAGWGATLLGLAEVTLVQALPLPLLMLRLLTGQRGPATAVNAVLAATRVGVLAGMARAYRCPPWTYWLSPLSDVPVALRLCASALQRRHVWRGRPLVDGGG
ncbi:glycosyltransferase [Sphaerobacter thermophilus]|uniref:Glycosyl transferase family 2 n=1 Tax=Sphaerobacter thermophilus (strain ATCC 49802 / DSM 20745 / KCCM 41009 / NCIMB 13125 / S 6022) TaxID=479434 RepID=D1C5V3_SPHTD|nr:glycosyltransferase [Sphaerobacter thermophilus]ACZ39505.1 glycosyl transferase family 2 [Sphaerobacter thermophilus DSM 20745]